ncbi:MAG TPA: hypothetical protein VH497_19920 [Vicinamibacterales bacterium]|jgi:hypothetical protein
MRRVCFPLFMMVLIAMPAWAQSGPCTESAIKQGKTPTSEDLFSYMPPYGRPRIGRGEVQQANTDSFSKRTNVTRSWGDDHRIIPSASGDMAYEYGTQRMGYDENGKHTDFEAAMLIVYRAKGSVCETVALTMHPLEDPPK